MATTEEESGGNMGKGRKETLGRGPFVYDTQGDKKEGRKIEIAQAKKDQDHL